MQTDDDIGRDDRPTGSERGGEPYPASDAASATGYRALLLVARKNCQAEDCIEII